MCKAIRDIREEERMEGRKEGREEGREEGRNQLSQNTACNLRAMGMEIPFIAKALETTSEQVASWLREDTTQTAL